jgi:hypothetical protein
MSRFIRTKNGKIISYDENANKIDLPMILNYPNQILKQADTIRELCDEFCYIKNGVVSQYLTIDFKFKRNDEFCALRNKLTANGIAEISKGISKYELENGELKFAIWTDKGLIYVAKMNSEGELELI